jgi:hypothetical protein
MDSHVESSVFEMMKLNNKVDMIFKLIYGYVVEFTVTPDRGFVMFVFDIFKVSINNPVLSFDSACLWILDMLIRGILHASSKVDNLI